MMIPATIAEEVEDADDHESTGTETPFVPGFLDDPIHISITGKLRKAPQISELKPDPKQKKRGNLLLLMYYLRSNIYNNRKLLLGDQKPVLVKKQFSQQQLTTQGKGASFRSAKADWGNCIV